MSPLLLHRLGAVLHSLFMWMLVFMLKEDICKCEWKPTTAYATQYICLVSSLHIRTKYLELQACKKLAHGGGWHPPTFCTQYSGGGLDGTQYAKGRYAVRKNSDILYADINFYYKKVQFSSKNTTHMTYKVK